MRQNHSTKFILPLLGSDYRQFKGIINCYIGDSLQTTYKNHIFILYPIHDEKYEEKLSKFLNHNNYVDDYFYDDYHMFVFNYPSGYEHIKDLFINGQYSKFDDEYKTHTVNFHSARISRYFLNGDKNDKSEDNIISYPNYIKSVLYKHDLLFTKYEKLLDMKLDKNVEIGNMPTLDEEIFNTTILNSLQREQLSGLNLKEWD